MGATYDPGARLAAEKNDRGIWALHARCLARGALPVVPAGVLAQSWRGGPQPNLSRLLRGCRCEDLDELRARAVGYACAQSETKDIVDASVVVGALARGDLVVTSDTDDIGRIADALGRSLALYEI
jgi:hypothetical protein